MTAFRSVLCGATLIATVGVSAAANAQLTASLEAFGGYYRPSGQFSSPPNVVTQMPSQPSDLQGPAWGAVAHLTLGNRLGVAGELATTTSHQIPVPSTPAGLWGPTNASVVLATLLAQYDLSATPSAYHFWVNAGPAVIHHGGDAYAPYGAPTSVGGAFGMTFVVPLRWHLELSADATGLFYTLNVPMHSESGMTAGSLQHGNQRDTLLRLGLAWMQF